MKRLFAILSAIMLLGCESKTVKKDNYLRMAWWGGSERNGQTAKAAILFENANSGVKIETEAEKRGSYAEKINLLAATGTLPDLVQLSADSLVHWAKAGRLADLTPFVQNGALSVSTMSQNALNAAGLNGKIFGICVGESVLGVAVNTQILAKAGVEVPEKWTWQDFERIAKTVFTQTGAKTNPFWNDASAVFETYVRENGARLFAADGSDLGFSGTEEAEAFFSLVLHLSKSLAVLSEDESDGAFAAGKAWNEFVWLDEFLEAETGGYARFLPLPKKTSAAEDGSVLFPSIFFAVPLSAENPALAIRALHFFMNDESAQELFFAHRGVPSMQKARENSKIQSENAIAAAFFDCPVLESENQTEREVRTLFNETVQNVLSASLSAVEGAREFTSKAHIVLGK